MPRPHQLSIDFFYSHEVLLLPLKTYILHKAKSNIFFRQLLLLIPYYKYFFTKFN